MNILFDLSSTQPVSGNDFHGGSEYAKTVFSRFCELFPKNLPLEVFYNPRKKIEAAMLDLCKKHEIKTNLCKDIAEINELLRVKKYNVFYSALPYSYTDIVIPAETKFIYTIHGLRNLEYPADRYELKYKKSSAKEKIKHFLSLFIPDIWKKYKSKKGIDNFNRLFSRTKNQSIVTVSNHSKYAISYFFPHLDVSRINVFYSPMKKSELDNGGNIQILDALSLESGKYILLIGGDRSEKGAYRACKVLDKLLKNHSGIPGDIKVLVLGVSNYGSYRKLTNNSSRFVFHRYVSTGDLETLYKNAFLFMYPTLNEGFGYPPLEAMKYGIVCVCSANSAITEVYADSVIYFNPFDEIEMGIRLLQSFDNNIRNEIIKKMSSRYQIIRKKQEDDLDLLVKTIISAGETI